MRLLLFCLSCFIFLSTPFTSAQEENPAGTISKFSGTVKRKREGAKKPEPITQKTKDLALHQNDTVTTGEDGHATIVLSEGTTITLAPSTTVSLKKTDDHITVELKAGKVRVDCKSDSFTLVTPYHTFTGAGASLEVSLPRDNEVTVFCIDGKLTVTDQNGFQIFSEEGQIFTVNYDDKKKEFHVEADEYNEESLNCKGKEVEYKIPPGSSLWVDSDLNVRTKEEIVAKREEIVVKLPKIEEPRDEPYEDAGDIYQLPIVSPKKP